jgi:hypothetical protein
MSGAVCPSCGVAIVPGYVRCPKCRKPLPQRPSAVEGGTAVESPSRGGPALIGLVAIILAAGGILAYVALRKDKATTAKAVPTAQAEAPSSPTPQPSNVLEQPGQAQAQPTGPNAVDVAADLERALKKQRLWSTVEVTGSRADVRSSSCNDPAMAPMLDGAAPSFKASGLTKLRCVEQSGRVVTDRDL